MDGSVTLTSSMNVSTSGGFHDLEIPELRQGLAIMPAKRGLDAPYEGFRDVLNHRVPLSTLELNHDREIRGGRTGHRIDPASLQHGRCRAWEALSGGVGVGQRGRPTLEVANPHGPGLQLQTPGHHSP